MAAGTCLLLGGMCQRIGAFPFLPRRFGLRSALRNAEPDTGSGDLSIACHPQDRTIGLTYSWADAGPVTMVDARAGPLHRSLPVSYDPDGMGVATFALPVDDPLPARFAAGRPIGLRYDDGRPSIRPVKQLLASCQA